VLGLSAISLSAAGIELVREDENHVVLTHANVMFVIWLGEQQPEACAAAYDLSVKLARKCGTNRVSVVSIVHEGMTRPSSAAREALARLHEDPESVTHRTAVVIFGGGFIGAIVRSIVLSVRQHASRRQRHEVFGSLDQALSWVTEGLPTPCNRPIPISQLVAALSRLEAIYPARVA
jgi:hypothetical protein